MKNSFRYDSLVKEFYMEKVTFINMEKKQSYERILDFVYHHTDIYYIEHIESNTLYEYIRYHLLNSYNQLTFTDIIKDIKHFLYFLKYVRKLKAIPHIDLSLKSIVKEVI